MARVALLTVGILHGEWGDSVVQGFMDRNEAIWDVVKTIPGFICTVDSRVGSEEPYSRFYRPGEHTHYADTLSLWENLEAVVAFAYFGLHGEAFRKRREWFMKQDAPNHAAWWVADDHIPDWNEAYEMQWQLHQSGSTALVFDLRQPYRASGMPYTINREEVKRMVADHPALFKNNS